MGTHPPTTPIAGLDVITSTITDIGNGFRYGWVYMPSTGACMHVWAVVWHPDIDVQLWLTQADSELDQRWSRLDAEITGHFSISNPHPLAYHYSLQLPSPSTKNLRWVHAWPKLDSDEWRAMNRSSTLSEALQKAVQWLDTAGRGPAKPTREENRGRR